MGLKETASAVAVWLNQVTKLNEWEGISTNLIVLTIQWFIRIYTCIQFCQVRYPEFGHPLLKETLPTSKIKAAMKEIP